MTIITPTKFRLRQDTLANWTAINPVLQAGEPAWETDTNTMRVGDGVAQFLDLVAFLAVTDIDQITGNILATLAPLGNDNLGATAPSNPVAGMRWRDTSVSPSVLRIRNDANTAWPLLMADNAVTNAKLANVATATLKGRVTAATGDPEDLTVEQVQTLLEFGGLATQDIIDTITGTSAEAPMSQRAAKEHVAGAIASAAGVLTTIAPVDTTSGTSVDFTGIPSWVQRITMTFVGVSKNSTSNPLVQVGNAGGYVTSGYISASDGLITPDGFIVEATAASDELYGTMTLTKNAAGVWVQSHVVKVAGGIVFVGAGSIAGAGTVDRIRLTTISGTNTFDSGSVGITYE
jgi:hypothetical protein